MQNLTTEITATEVYETINYKFNGTADSFIEYHPKHHDNRRKLMRLAAKRDAAINRSRQATADWQRSRGEEVDGDVLWA